MQTDFLEYLLDVRETGSMSKTAEHFYISYQSIRAGISNLERFFQVKLIECDNRGCKLTEAGELVADFAETMRKEEKVLVRKLEIYRSSSEFVGNAQADIKIYVVPYLIDEVFIRFFVDYRKRQKRKYNMQLEVISIPELKKIETLIFDKNCVVLGVHSDAKTEINDWDSVAQKYKLLKQQLPQFKLFLSVKRGSKWDAYTEFDETNLASIPVFGNKMDELIDLPGNYQVVNGFAEQKKLVDAGMGGIVCTNAVSKMYFNESAKYNTIPVCLEAAQSMSYIALYTENAKENPEIKKFLNAWQEIM